jgi:hypothetical protein
MYENKIPQERKTYTTELRNSNGISPQQMHVLNRLAEAGVKSAKSLLRRGIGKDILTVVKLICIFVTIECLFYSRP